MKKKKKITGAELDQIFDDGGDIMPYMDMKTLKVDYPIQRINVDIPREILNKVDREATRVGVTRTSLIKLWIAERVDRLAG